MVGKISLVVRFVDGVIYRSALAAPARFVLRL